VIHTGGRVRLTGELPAAVKESLARAELSGQFEATADAVPAPNRQARQVRGIAALEWHLRGVAHQQKRQVRP
jgi:hypothetical protein